jgi:hypothetical protein
VLQASKDRANYWVCTDSENGLVCLFEHKKFNDTQEFTFLDDFNPDPSTVAKVAREMGDWLSQNHYDKVL